MFGKNGHLYGFGTPIVRFEPYIIICWHSLISSAKCCLPNSAILFYLSISF